jgi:dienelactone hydrolase
VRPLESLLPLSLAAALVGPFLPAAARRRWAPAAAALVALTVALHLGVERWRPQMAPLYAVAVAVVVATAAVATRGRRRVPSPSSSLVSGPGSGLRFGAGRRSVVAVGLAAIVVAGGGVLAGWLMPVVTLPTPTGPHPVGIVDREVTAAAAAAAARAGASGRRLMATVWYPAAAAGPDAPLTRHPDQIAAALGNLAGLPALAFHHLRHVDVAAAEGAAVLEAPAPFPVLVFSHGMVGLRSQNAPTFQELASWGYVVVALDHTDAAAVTVFPDGEERFYDPERFGIAAGIAPTHAEVERKMFPVWVADQRAAYDAVATWAVDDPLLAGALDPSRMGSFGHSFGGATALEVCRVDARCRAAANLDGGLYGGIGRDLAVRPLLVISSADSAENAEAVAGWADLVERATAGATWLELPNSSHLSFTFSELLSPLLVPPGYDPRAGLQVVADHLRAFFDAELRAAGAPSPAPAADADAVRIRAEHRPR